MKMLQVILIRHNNVTQEYTDRCRALRGQHERLSDCQDVSYMYLICPNLGKCVNVLRRICCYQNLFRNTLNPWVAREILGKLHTETRVLLLTCRQKFIDNSKTTPNKN